MYLNLHILFFLFLILLPSCTENEANLCIEMERIEGPMPFRTFAEVSNDSIDCFLTVTDTVFHTHPVFHIINDQEALDTLLECNCYDYDFDFQNYTLLIGYFFTYYGPATLSKQELDLYCDLADQHLMYRVFVDEEDDPYQPTLIQHNAIVPKLPDELRVSHGIIRNKL